MIYKELTIEVEGMEAAATLTTYLLSQYEDVLMKPTPLVIICPGGGYEFLSNREAEQFALQWNARGIHAAVLRYSIAPARYPAALLQLAKTVLLVREKSKEWGVNPEQIFLEGSSAGGHLAACYGAFWKKKDLRGMLGISE